MKKLSMLVASMLVLLMLLCACGEKTLPAASAGVKPVASGTGSHERYDNSSVTSSTEEYKSSQPSKSETKTEQKKSSVVYSKISKTESVASKTEIAEEYLLLLEPGYDIKSFNLKVLRENPAIGNRRFYAISCTKSEADKLAKQKGVYSVSRNTKITLVD